MPMLSSPPRPGEPTLSERLGRLAIASVLGIAVAGCVRIPGGVAPSDIPLHPDGYEILGPVEGGDCKVNLFGVIPVSGGNHILDAIEKVKRKRPGTDALIQITVDRASKFFIFWTQVCTEVRAIAVRRVPPPSRQRSEAW